MPLEYWILGGAGTMLIGGVVCLLIGREPIRNGYQARQRTRLKGGRTAIIEPKDDPRIVGDGARDMPTQAKYPQRVREVEPRGS